jgi:acyl transferase domain-containing protein
VNRGERIRQKSDEIAQGISTLHQMGYQIFLEMGISANLINIGRQKLGVNSILWLSSLPEFDVRKSARNQWSKELETFCPRNSILNKN